MAEQVFYVSLKPSDAVAGGAMVPEGEHDIAQARFTSWDYNGTVVPPVPALCIEYRDGAQSYQQYYSAGDIKSMEPTEDGKRLQTKSPRGLNVSTNCYAYLKSLVDNGFDEAKLANDISVITGARVKIIHEEAPEREIAGKKLAKRMIPVIGGIIAMPGENKAKAKPKAAPAATARKANGAEAAATDLSEKAADVLIQVLKSKGGSLHMTEVTRGIYAAMPGSDTDRAGILNLVILESFLTSPGLTDRGVIYDRDKTALMYVGD